MSHKCRAYTSTTMAHIPLIRSNNHVLHYCALLIPGQLIVDKESWPPNLSAPLGYNERQNLGIPGQLIVDKESWSPNLSAPLETKIWASQVSLLLTRSPGHQIWVLHWDIHKPKFRHPRSAYCWRGVWPPNLSAPLGKTWLLKLCGERPWSSDSCWAGATPHAMRSNKTQNLLTDCSHRSLVASCRDRGKNYSISVGGRPLQSTSGSSQTVFDSHSQIDQNFEAVSVLCLKHRTIISSVSYCSQAENEKSAHVQL